MSGFLFLIASLLLGFACGLRGFTPLALTCWLAVWGWMPLGGTRLAFLGTTVGAVVVTLLAIGELIGDKLPVTPARTTAFPLSARIITGALSVAGMSIGAGQSWIVGILCGAVGAVVGAFAGFRLRRFFTTQWGVRDWIVAVAEDIVTVALSLGVFALVF